MTDSKASSRPRIVLVNRSLVLDEKNNLLLIKRSRNDSYHPGLWELPGGKLDKGQDLSHAMEREVLEETGLLVEAVSRLAYADSEVIAEGKYKGLPYVALFSICRSLGGKIKLSEEHEAYKWVDFEEAQDLELTPEVRKALIVLEKSVTESR